MLEEITVIVDDRAGVLADIGELLGANSVNIETLAATTFNGRGVVHLIVDDGEEAGEVLSANGFKVDGVRPVMTATLDDRPGELGNYCRRLSEAGVAISSAYLGKRGNGETEIIFAVDDLESATRA
jgi:hypothetical protein